MNEQKHLLQYNIDKYPFYKRNSGRDLMFFHIPKTGGTSINRAFEFPRPNQKTGIRKHYSSSKIRPLIDEFVWGDAFKFCFVRNPWDRVYSHYMFRKRKQKLTKEKHYTSFESWLFFKFYNKKNYGNLKSQIKWIEDSNGLVDLDFIGRFENLNEDFQKICKINNLKRELPHTNKNMLKVNYRTQFNNEMIDLVAAVYKKDIEHFNYSF